LEQAAQQKAQDMIKNNYFAHTSPAGTSPWYWFDKVDYNYVAAGENLAKDFTDSKYLHQAWMNSSSHRANILNEKFQEIAIVIIEGKINGENTILAVQLFGKLATPKNTEVKPEPKPEPKQPTTPEVAVTVPEPEVSSPSVIGSETNQRAVNIQSQGTEIPAEKMDSVIGGIYFFIAGLLTLVLLLTIFVNIRVQYPRLIFASIIIILLIAGIASFNGQEFLNRAIDIV